VCCGTRIASPLLRKTRPRRRQLSVPRGVREPPAKEGIYRLLVRSAGPMLAPPFG